MRSIILNLAISIAFTPMFRLHAVEDVAFTAHKVPAITVKVPGNWTVLAMQTKLPIAMAAFQIPNPADIGTSDSTNVAIAGFATDSKEAQAALQRIKSRFFKKDLKTRSSSGWVVEEYSSEQDATTYTVLDASLQLFDRTLFVRLAWPQLAKNPSDYGDQMKQIFQKLLETTK